MASILWLPVFILSATVYLYLISTMVMPQLSTGDSGISLKFPKSIEDIHSVSALLNQYKDEHISYVLLLFCSAYLYKQTFAIPGSVFMNILCGALFGMYGFPLVCLLTACGATCCYLLSQLCGRPYIIKYFPTKISHLQKKVEETKEGLFFYLLFVRLFPMSPNWLLNMMSPVANVPIHWFFMSVLIGLMPYNFICVQTGCILHEITGTDDLLTPKTVVGLIALALVVLLPGLLLRKKKREIQMDAIDEDIHVN